jgi:hypothetical protein
MLDDSRRTRNDVRGKTISDLFLLLILLAGIGLAFYFLKTEEGVSLYKQYGLKIGIIVLSLIAWFKSQSMIAGREMNSGLIGDGIHELTEKINSYFADNAKKANILLVVTSLLIDFFGLFIIGAAIFGPSMKPFIALLILFAMRQVCQAFCALPAPPQMIWRNPGFPSLLVTYGVSNDFFFSGHTAVAVLGSIVIFNLCPLWLGVVAGLVAVFEMAAVLVLRAHYTMDVFSAVVAAFCSYGLASWICTFV